LKRTPAKQCGQRSSSKASPRPKSLGEMLTGNMLIAQKQLEHAQELQRAQDKKVSEVLTEQHFVSPEHLAMLGIQMNLPSIDLKQRTTQPEAFRFSEKSCQWRWLEATAQTRIVVARKGREP